MNLQTTITFPVHTVERTAEGTAHVQANAAKLGGNCKKIMQHFQKQNVPLTDDKAREWIGVRNLAQRIADLRHNGIVILDRWDDSKQFKLYSLGCQCASPRNDTTGCWLHDSKLKIV